MPQIAPMHPTPTYLTEWAGRQTSEQIYLATSRIVVGNHNDAFELKDNLRAAFKFIKGH